MRVRFRPGAVREPHGVECLSDHGPPFVAQLMRQCGALVRFLVVNTPAYSPELNGMADCFVSVLKLDCAYFN
jgi:hypothetical protein